MRASVVRWGHRVEEAVRFSLLVGHETTMISRYSSSVDTPSVFTWSQIRGYRPQQAQQFLLKYR